MDDSADGMDAAAPGDDERLIVGLLQCFHVR
jgi:hypothetical protein